MEIKFTAINSGNAGFEEDPIKIMHEIMKKMPIRSFIIGIETKLWMKKKIFLMKISRLFYKLSKKIKKYSVNL